MKTLRVLSLLLIGAIASLSATLSAQRSFVLPNSPDGQSRLHVYLPDPAKATGRAVVALPGGGYHALAMGREGRDWAPWFNDRGIAWCVVEYRMPEGNPAVTVGDASRAFATVRDSAAVWHINPRDVGVAGFSAGGHLAALMSTTAPLPVRPDFQMLFYPVITMGKGTDPMSASNFLGNSVNNEDSIRAYSPQMQVKRHLVPPTLILQSNDDPDVDLADNGLTYFTALRNADVATALNIYPDGGHGWGFRSSFAHHDQLLADVEAWLADVKAPKPDAVRVACVGNSITDGYGIPWSDTYGYPAQLGAMLGDGYNVKNYGVGARTMLNKGDHPYMIEQAWRDCLDFRPQIVVIKLGTNDSKDHNWVYASEYTSDMQQMIDALKALDSHPRIMLAYPVKAWKNTWTINDRVISEEIIPALNELARKNGLETIDLYEPTSHDESLFIPDGIHPGREGAEVMARKVAEAIRGN